MNRQLAAMPYLRIMCLMGVLGCRAVYRDCRIVRPFVGFVGMSDAFPDMPDVTWTSSVVPKNDCRKCLSDIVGLSDCRIVGHCRIVGFMTDSIDGLTDRGSGKSM
jgi:hypothetical protein